MRIKLILSILFVVSMLVPIRSFASTAPEAESNVVISEISMGSSSSATEEFIELYNNNDSAISIDNWSIYYRSATGTSYSKKATSLSTSIGPRAFFTFSTDGMNNSLLMSGMSQTGGVVELRDSKNNVVERVGYGNANLASGKVAVAPQAGESIYREYDTQSQAMINTKDNFSDFNISTAPTPGTIPSIEVEDLSESTVYPDIYINEIYPNPDASQSENLDEYIELHNPNNFTVDLSGWLIKDSSGKTYIIKDQSIEAFGYAVFYSAQTSIALNNNGDVVELYSPTSELKDQTQDYVNAKEGLSWGLVDGAWAWNNSSTPGYTNSQIYVEVVAAKSVATKSTAKKQAAKKAAAKKASTKKPKAAKLKANKAQASSSKDDTQSSPDIQSKFTNIWPWLMIVLGTATIGYGIYEYKPEITNTYMRLKKKFESSK